ncbi:MAG TPA: J domain-containing protein [Lysobacter sp.]|nr:J domain-containing protein [Lysobacter sp.]
MAHDFVKLYAELGLQPDCSLDELKLAYRRRVAELHPDRLGPDAISADSHQRLSNLIASYRASLRFHRQYGRLPGCNHSRVPYAGTRRKRLAQTASMPSPDLANDDPALPLARAVVIAIVLIAGLLLLQMAWDRQESGGGQGFSGAPSGYVPCLAGADPDLSATASDRVAEPRTERTQADTADAPAARSTARTPGCVDL